MHKPHVLLFIPVLNKEGGPVQSPTVLEKKKGGGLVYGETSRHLFNGAHHLVSPRMVSVRTQIMCLSYTLQKGAPAAAAQQ